MYSLLLILIMITTSLYTLYNTRHILKQFDYMFINDVYLTDISKEIKGIDDELLKYLTTRNSDSLGEYIVKSDSLRQNLKKIDMEPSYDNGYVILQDISNMINGYLIEGDAAISGKRGRDVNEYNKRYKEAKNIAGYIDEYIKQLNINQFHENTEKYFYISENLKILEIINIVIIGFAFLLNVVITFWFSGKTAIPIVRLAKSANEISKGNFETKDIVVDSGDEIKVMADAFNKMKDNIKTYIEELKIQAEIEITLKDEKMANLKMKNLLKNAELKALQSQINPHFLFNTLNAGVQLAMMEDAEKTSYFLEKMSELFRYNLRKMDNPVTLMEELQNVYAYIFLLETRFGDLIKFEYYIDENALDISMPSLILQPIIENACIHGVGDMEVGGKITLKVEKTQDLVIVSIEDNGKGIDDKTIKDILSLEIGRTKKNDPKKKGHTTGIGMDNVIERLKYFYGNEDVIEIKSKLGEGTSVMLKLPLRSGDENYV